MKKFVFLIFAFCFAGMANAGPHDCIVNCNNEYQACVVDCTRFFGDENQECRKSCSRDLEKCKKHC
jgi:hypothetical protein